MPALNEAHGFRLRTKHRQSEVDWRKAVRSLEFRIHDQFGSVALAFALPAAYVEDTVPFHPVTQIVSQGE